MSSAEHDHVATELLAALAMGESADELGLDPQQRDHLADCASCTAEVAALRETLELIAVGGGTTLARPPASVWEGVRAELGRPPEVTPIRRRRAVPTWFAATAAAVALAAGVGLGAWIVAPDQQDEPAPQAQVVGEAPLASLDGAPEDRGAAVVRRVGDHLVLHVEASDLGGPAGESDGTREVWLINVDGKRMVSLGLLPAGEAGDFDFPERLLDRGYRIVDISYEPDDGDPVHSGQSLARGEIA
ncbi:anti-sigma factor [Nocardioides jishulii]|uniref:Anti-sigma factor n=1 Tax=Nocardioides jishulii TaxID=2575440 RepID=A0A4U2YT48_9ACTN|nr:anti-sigma factor [Nocardioides jishulii]QCX26383.1 anti-sigma factor [Nocardioides jishulii]TKI63812.1 anti-sigma factor [Nocardioides jishulii]